MYSTYSNGLNAQRQQKGKLKFWCVLDTKDWSLTEAEVEEYPHPLEDCLPHIYNSATGRNCPLCCEFGWLDCDLIKKERKYIVCLSNGFYNSISSSIKTMSVLKKQEKGNKVRPVTDLENIFLQILEIGQQRQIKPDPPFAHEMHAVPALLTDEHSCLHKGSKSELINHLCLSEILPTPVNIVIVVVSQLLCGHKRVVYQI